MRHSFLRVIAAVLTKKVIFVKKSVHGKILRLFGKNSNEFLCGEIFTDEQNDMTVPDISTVNLLQVF